MDNTEKNDQYIDINKGFRRLGNFSPFADEKFTTYAAAAEYARNGAYGGTAYPSQRIVVMPEDGSEDEQAVYLIDNSYSLVSTTSNVITNEKLTAQFNYAMESGSDAMSVVVPAGFIIDNISIKIIDAFNNDDAVSVGYYEGSKIKYLVSSDDICSDEDESEFNFKITKHFDTKTKICIFLKRDISNPNKGSGIMKIN